MTSKYDGTGHLGMKRLNGIIIDEEVRKLSRNSGRKQRYHYKSFSKRAFSVENSLGIEN